MYSIFRNELHELGMKYLTELKKYLSGEINISTLEKIQYEKLKEVLDSHNKCNIVNREVNMFVFP